MGVFRIYVGIEVTESLPTAWQNNGYQYMQKQVVSCHANQIYNT